MKDATTKMMGSRIERFAVTLDDVPIAPDTGRVRGRATPYNITDGRPGDFFDPTRLDSDGFPELVRFESSVFVPGVFNGWLEAGGLDRMAFLYEHGGANDVVPFYQGILSLPLGKITMLEDRPDGLYWEAEYASHELARTVRDLTLNGTLKEVSFSMAVSAFSVAEVEGVNIRYIKAAECYDISQVVQGQFGPYARVTEVYSQLAKRFAPVKRFQIVMPGMATETEPMTTVAACLESAVYDAFTDTVQDFREDNVITADEFIALNDLLTGILRTMRETVGDDLGNREVPDEDEDLPEDDDDEETAMEAGYKLVRAGVSRFAGAAISKANAAPLLAAVDDLRAAAASLQDHADTIEAIVTSGSNPSDNADEPPPDDSKPVANSIQKRLERIAVSLRMSDLNSI